MNKVLGTENPADMGTKGLNGDQIDKFIKMLNMEHREGRAGLAPDLNKLVHDDHCKRLNSAAKRITNVLELWMMKTTTILTSRKLSCCIRM